MNQIPRANFLLKPVMENHEKDKNSHLNLEASVVPVLYGNSGHASDDQAGHASLRVAPFSAVLKTFDGSCVLNLLQMRHNENPVVNALDLTQSSVLERVKSFSTIDLTGTINNTIKLNWAAVAILSDAFDAAVPSVDSARILVVSGNPGDVMQLVNLSSWSMGAVQSAQALSTAYGHLYQFMAGHAYKPFSLYGATVFVDEVMKVDDAAVRIEAQVKSQVFSIEKLFGSSASVPVGIWEGDSWAPQAEGVANDRFQGVAIVFAGTGGANGDTATTGHYELSKDGGVSWMVVEGDLSDTTAVYADKSALLRFVATNNAETIQPQNLMVRLLDDAVLQGSAHYGADATGRSIDVSGHGLRNALGEDELAMLGRPSKTEMLSPPDQHRVEDDGDGLVPVGDVGSSVSNLVGWGHDQVGKGIAITGVDKKQGTLYFSTDGGGIWTEVTRPLTENNALFMRSDGNNRVYFKPSTGLSLHSGDALTIRAWDQSQKTETIFFNTTTDGLTLAEAEAALNFKQSLTDLTSAQVFMVHAQAPATPVNEWQNTFHKLSDYKWGDWGHLPARPNQKSAAELMSDAIAAAIATSVKSSMTKLYTLSQSAGLDLGAMLSPVRTDGVHADMSDLDMAQGSESKVVYLTMTDVLSLPAFNGVHQLKLTGGANDKLVLSKGEWSDTGVVVNQNGHKYAVYTGSTDSKVQLLIEEQMLNGLLFTSL